MKNKPRISISNPAIIALGFLLLIALGTALLCLPIASRGEQATLTQAFFTAVSASCVTGLAVVDTYTQWSVFGQVVLLVLIQIGGLGFMTILAMFSMFLRRRVGLRARSLLQESINTRYIGGIMRLARRVLYTTACAELCGAALLALRMVPVLGPRGCYVALFTAISAFCNAGFDITGAGPVGSLSLFLDDPVVLLCVSALILMGGIGFFVWDDIARHGWHLRRYLLHSKIALFVTVLLTLLGALFFSAVEWNHTLADLTPLQKIAAGLFLGVTPRTAGFSVVENAALCDASKLLTLLYMVVGGSPGSTAGGVKTTTVAALVCAVVAALRGRQDSNVAGRRLEEDVPRRAAAVMGIHLTLALGASLLMSVLHSNVGLVPILFECFSALGTVGMSLGITAQLGVPAQLLLCLLMYLGRVGSLSFTLIFINTRPSLTRLPAEKISIG